MALASVSIGTMNFGGRTSATDAERIVLRALDAEATLFDTANAYGDGESERILGAALKGRRDRARIATKVGLKKREGLSKASVLAAADESLSRLRTEYVDLYYLHAPDPHTPLADTLDAMQTLLESGKIRAWGVSNFASWQIMQLNALCDSRAMPRPAASQVLYNLLVRQLDLEYFAFERAHPIHTTVYNPLAGGLLARVPVPGEVPPKGSRFDRAEHYRKRYWNASLIKLASRFDELAAAHGHSLLALAYAFVVSTPGVHSVLCGPATVEHLEAALKGCATELAADVRQKVDAIYRDFIGTDASYAR
jgi:aryl-alcohol dehydrogenase-like predicted oxidoreductase